MLAGFAGLIAVGGLVAATGYPQTRLAEYGIRRATGFSARIEGLSLLPHVHIGQLRVFSEVSGEPPILSMTNLTVAYDAFPDSGRWIEHVSAERVSLFADSALIKRIEAMAAPQESAKAAGLAFVPRKVSFPLIETRLRLPSVQADATDIAVSLDIESPEAFAFEVRSDALTGHLHLPLSDFATSLDGGSLLIAGQRDRAAFTLDSLRASLPNFAEIESTATVHFGDETAQLALDITAFRILGEGEKTVLLPGTGMPVTVGSFTVANAHAAGAYFLESGRFVPVYADAAGRATHIRFGTGDAEWYVDSAEFRAEGELPGFSLELVLNENLPLHMAVFLESESSVSVSAALNDWRRDALARLLPHVYADYLDMFPTLHSVSAHTEAVLHHPNYEATLTLTPTTGDGGQVFPSPIQVRAAGVLGASASCSGDLTFPVGDGSIHAAFAVAPPEPPHAHITLNTLEPERLLAITRWGPVPEFAARTVSGTLDTFWDGEIIGVEARIEGTSSPWGTEFLYPSEVSAEGHMRYHMITGVLEGSAFSMSAGEHFTARSPRWRLQFDPLEFEGVITGRVEPARVSPWAEELELGADARFTAPLAVRDGMAILSWDAESDYVRLGDYSLFDAPLRTTGRALIALDNYASTFHDVAVRYGETSSLIFDEGTLALDPFHFETPYRLSSQLHLLVDAGLLDAIEGHAEAFGRISWKDDLALTSEYEIEAPLLVTADSTLALGGLRAAGNFQMDPSLNGHAEMHAAECAVAGVPLRNIAGPVVFEGNSMRLEHFIGELFDGIVRGTVAVDLSDGAPVVATAVQLRNIDLAQFAETMIPPEYAVRGLAQGRVTARLTPEGLDDATIKLVSSGDFAINKSLLQSALLEYLRGLRGRQTIERISTDVLGTDDWRPFDSATLDLAWVRNGISGDINLRSVNLNLQIDLNVDEGSVRQILALQQQARLENVENIRSEPVQQMNR